MFRFGRSRSWLSVLVRLRGRLRDRAGWIIAAGAGQIALHPRDVMPVVELPFHAAVQTGLVESQRPVKGVAGIVRLSDASEDSPIAALAEPVEKLRVQLSAAAATVMVAVEVDTGLDRPSIGGMEIEGMSVGESDDLVVVFED